MAKENAVPGTNGNKYVPFAERSGEKSIVYFTRDLSPEGLKKIYDRVSEGLTGKVAVKLHTGEAEGLAVRPRHHLGVCGVWCLLFAEVVGAALHHALHGNRRPSPV